MNKKIFLSVLVFVFFSLTGVAFASLTFSNTGITGDASFTTLTIPGISTSGCLTINGSGVVSSTGVACGSGTSTWGSITGTLSAQSDLNTALNGKQATLVSGTNIKTVGGTSLLGSGDIAVGGSGTVTSVGLAGTANQITVTGTSPITNSGSFTLSIPNNPTLPGTTTGTFSGSLTGTASNATNLAGGLGGSIPYQSAAGTTAMLGNGTAGQVLTSAGTTLAPTWSTISSSTANALNSATTVVNVSSATAPINGQVLTATSGTTATWQTPSGGTTRTYLYEYSGICQGGVAGFSLNLPSSNSPVPGNCTNSTPVLSFPTTQSNYNTWASIVLPAGFTTGGTINYTIESRSADSTHAAIITPAWAKASAGADVNTPSYNTLSTVNITGAAASGRVATTGSFTATAAAAGDRLWFKITADTNTNTLTSSFDLISLKLSLTGNN